LKELLAVIYKSLCEFFGYVMIGTITAALAAAFGGLVVLVPWYYQHRAGGNLSWGFWALWGLATAVALGMLVSQHGNTRVQEVLIAWHKNPNHPAVQAVFEDARREFVKGKINKIQNRAYQQTLDDFKRRVTNIEEKGTVTLTQKPQLRPVYPFEGMPDVCFLAIVAALSGIGVFMLGGILRWTAAAVVGLASLYVSFRLAMRLFPRYARLHNSLACRYWALSGLHAGAAIRAGKPPVANEDFVCRFLSDAVYLNLDRDSARELLREAQFKAKNCVDRAALLREFVRRHPEVDSDRFGTALDQFVRSAADASPIPGYIPEWLFADVIERRYGEAERVRYLADVITGRARVGIMRPFLDLS